MKRLALYRLGTTAFFLVLLGGKIAGVHELLIDLCQIGEIFRF